jgi:isocitrate dehydrogenase
MKSLNVTIRNTLGLFANVRPCISYHPFISSKHPKIDLVIIRENEEDLYSGIEHQQTKQVFQCLKLMSFPGSEKIIRYAFEYARRYGRKKVSCLVKDNIMKLTDGMFHRVFDEVGAEYPEIEKNHFIIDIGAARIADSPEIFDVVVTPNLYGDIVSDIAAQITGSVGIAGSANIGDHCAMFEAIHGAAPDIAGKGIANPSGLLLAAVHMLVHLGLPEHAAKINNALLLTIENGVHTGDIFREGSKRKVNTKEFTQAIIDNLGGVPKSLKAAALPPQDYKPQQRKEKAPVLIKKELVGVDVFLDWEQGSPSELGALLSAFQDEELTLKMITNRGVSVWPKSFSETFCTDHWRARFISPENKQISHLKVISLLTAIYESKLDFIKTENLYLFDGKPGFSLSH